ncbi:Sulfotransferase domain [Dillenia turbinata]|uniref:Sulfotransferase n=1 Tax=Dillenia turbinata TaxID=194707 RepID=A0AAN8Z1G7_9MAGN
MILKPKSVIKLMKGQIQRVSFFEPYWDHVLSHWRASLESPERILFLKYEELKRDTLLYVKELAKFIGYPFSSNKEKEGVIEEIINFCSFESISKYEVNKSRKPDCVVPVRWWTTMYCIGNQRLIRNILPLIFYARIPIILYNNTKCISEGIAKNVFISIGLFKK